MVTGHGDTAAPEPGPTGPIRTHLLCTNRTAPRVSVARAAAARRALARRTRRGERGIAVGEGAVSCGGHCNAPW
jgi:hypothetical protein